MERFLYRLSVSGHAGKFILKGALMLRVWGEQTPRHTMDIDMLGRTSNEEANIISQIKDIINTTVEADGIDFDPSSIEPESITEDAEYQGLRIQFQGKLDTALIRMQIDIGFGDIIYPDAEKLALPTMLEYPEPILFCYSKESVIAEKFDAMVKRGMLNSRMKDFHDIWHLSQQYEFDGIILKEAINKTLRQRDTVLPERIDSFTKDFADAKQVQWLAFRKRLKLDYAPTDFNEITSKVEKLISPMIMSILMNQEPPARWTNAGEWK